MTRLMTVLAASAGAAALAAAAPAAAQYAYPGYNGYPYGGQVHTSGNYAPNAWNNQYNGYNGYPYSGQPYTSGNYAPNAYPYGNQYGYGYNRYNAYNGYNRTSMAEQQCTSAVQARLQNRTGLTGAVNALLGRQGNARVNSITQARVLRSGKVRVKGLASSSSNYGPYGVGAYGALGYSQNPDLEFRCTVDANSRVTNVDIRKR